MDLSESDKLTRIAAPPAGSRATPAAPSLAVPRLQGLIGSQGAVKNLAACGVAADSGFGRRDRDFPGLMPRGAFLALFR